MTKIRCVCCFGDPEETGCSPNQCRVNGKDLTQPPYNQMPNTIPVVDIKDTLAQRQGTHGEFADNADIMQTLKDAVRARPGWDKLDATKREALDMILHKVGRIVTGNPEEPDHWHDIAGYATLARDRVKP